MRLTWLTVAGISPARAHRQSRSYPQDPKSFSSSSSNRFGERGILNVLGEAPPVIDAEELAENPEATVQAYCNAMGTSFNPEALSWDPGERPELGHFEGGIWHGVPRYSIRS